LRQKLELQQNNLKEMEEKIFILQIFGLYDTLHKLQQLFGLEMLMVLKFE
jgi:hypothetical protein